MIAYACWRSNRLMEGSHRAVCAFAALCSAAVLPEAAGIDLSSWQVHGFASQSAIYTTANNFFGNTDGRIDFDFTELGINGSIRPWNNVQLSGQLLARRAGKDANGESRLDYGFADYTFLPSTSYRWGLRVGRVKIPLGLYNETRDVVFTRPSILLPQSIYFDRTRNLALSADGAQIYGEHRWGDGEVFLQLGAGRLRVNDEDTERSVLGGDPPGDLESRTSYIGRLMYEHGGGWLRIAVSKGLAKVGYDSVAMDSLQDGSIDFDPLVFSLQYDGGNWSYTSEFALRPFKRQDFGPALPNVDVTGQSYYLQGTYRFAPEWEALLRWDVLYQDRDDKDGSRFEAITGQPRYTQFAKDLTVGVRWNIRPNIMLRAEYHKVNGTAWLPPQDNPDPSSTKQHWQMFMLLGAFRF
jgi:hypothetical protein